AGGAYVPIDPEYPQERIRYMLEDSDINIVLTKYASAVQMANFTGTLIDLNNPSVYKGDNTNLPFVTIAEDLAYVMYTSGSTGQPKGVLIEQRSVVRLVQNTNYVEFNEEDRILMTGAVVFDACTFEIWGALLNGLQLYIVPETVILSVEKLNEALKKYRITTMWLTSPLFNQLALQKPDAFSSLRYLLVGGDALSPNIISMVRSSCPDLTIINGYGPTENTTFSCCFPINKEYSNIPIGRPIANSTVYIVDESNTLLPVGIQGEICVGGDGLARGYLNRDELTREKFVPNPFVSGERMYRTGDLGRWLPDGTIEYLGRIDHQVKIRGYRIELGEVESVLQEVDSVREAVVVVRENEDGLKQLCAYFVGEESLTMAQLREEMSEELPEYMIPSYFVQLKQMPLTPNGKIDRKALPEPERNLQTGTEYVAPKNPIEEMLVSIWQTVLGVPQIGVLDNFFDLGGDSIKSIQVSSRLHQAGYRVDMK
ncbi:non-ribosomal peptide synthetase, partial [Bacillus cereus]|uniref:non-ribosomal peptide synthetase n=1 Tax=Bacillus cereus TaxID=1396 RepID=UPI001C557981